MPSRRAARSIERCTARRDRALPGASCVVRGATALNRESEHVGGAGLNGIVELRTVDAGRSAILGRRADGENGAITGQRDALAELVAEAGVGCLDVEFLAPGRGAAGEDVDGAGMLGRVVGLVT